MAVIHTDHPVLSRNEQNRCAFMFCMTWIGFFALVGAITFLVSLI